MVNRIWAQFFGRGLVNPLDDVRPENDQCTHPELLQKLADAFVASGFDLKFLARAICESETYQRACKPGPDAEKAEKFYGRKPVRVLTPLQLTNALTALAVFKPRPGKKGEEVAFLQVLQHRGRGVRPAAVRPRHPAAAAAGERPGPGGGAAGAGPLARSPGPIARRVRRAGVPAHPVAASDGRGGPDR